MSKLNEFRSLIDETNDPDVLKAGQQLLRDMIKINDLKRQLELLEADLTSDGKAIFYFFAEELDEDEVLFAAERITGKLSRLSEDNPSKEQE